MLASTALVVNSAQKPGLVRKRSGSLCHQPGTFGDAAERVIHCAVEVREKGNHLVLAALMLILQRVLGCADGDIHQEVAADRRPAELEMRLRLDRDLLQKFIRYKHFLSPNLNHSSR